MADDVDPTIAKVGNNNPSLKEVDFFGMFSITRTCRSLSRTHAGVDRRARAAVPTQTSDSASRS